MMYWRRFPAEYLVKTIGFTMEMDGCYTRLLDWYYTNERPLPLNFDDLVDIARASRESERAALQRVLDLKFERSPDGYHSDRADKEIGIAQRARANGAQNGDVDKPVDETQCRTQTKTQKATQKPRQRRTRNATHLGTESTTQMAHPLNLSTSQPPTLSESQLSPAQPEAGEALPPVRRARPRRLSNREILGRTTAGDPPAPEPAAQPPHPRNGSNGHDVDWWETPAGIQRHGREQGITIQPAQPWDDFRARVLAASGRGPWLDELTPDMRAKVEHWQVVGVHASG